MTLNSAVVTQSLEGIDSTYRAIIESQSRHVLASAQQAVRASYKRFSAGQAEKWGYEISSAAPLVFKPSAIRDLQLYVDVYCKIYWANTNVPIEQDIKIRVWTRHSRTMFRNDWDSTVVETELRRLQGLPMFRGRLISRWHFDQVTANPSALNQEFHPWHHLQYGGTDEPHEMSWHPAKVNMPRVPYPPMDLSLACQLVVANFYWNEHVKSRSKTEWLSRFRPIERALLLDYYRQCVAALERPGNGITLLDELCAL